MSIEITVDVLKDFLFNSKEINWGMTQQDVENILGKSARYEVNNLIDLTSEARDGTTFFYGKNGRSKVNRYSTVKIFESLL